MPGTYSYPGVYIEEIPSGVRTIAGVSTSDTAFIDFFARGPVGEAVRITSFADFERRFGGLDARSEAGYAIQQYYLNGGSIAWVVRVTAGSAQAASLTLQGGSPVQDTLRVDAASPGLWAAGLQGGLQVAVDLNTRDATRYFNLVVREVKNGQVVASEVHRNLSLDKDDSRYAVEVVKNN